MHAQLGEPVHPTMLCFGHSEFHEALHGKSLREGEIATWVLKKNGMQKNANKNAKKDIKKSSRKTPLQKKQEGDIPEFIKIYSGFIPEYSGNIPDVFRIFQNFLYTLVRKGQKKYKEFN